MCQIFFATLTPSLRYHFTCMWPVKINTNLSEQLWVAKSLLINQRTTRLASMRQYMEKPSSIRLCSWKYRRVLGYKSYSTRMAPLGWTAQDVQVRRANNYDATTYYRQNTR
uniref:Uncharacterized protein n=1 Tax=Bionectria ochroleuca TaxID=29856 RepID=A0A8H7TI71_BIOOC